MLYCSDGECVTSQDFFDGRGMTLAPRGDNATTPSSRVHFGALNKSVLCKPAPKQYNVMTVKQVR